MKIIMIMSLLMLASCASYRHCEEKGANKESCDQERIDQDRMMYEAAGSWRN